MRLVPSRNSLFNDVFSDFFNDSFFNGSMSHAAVMKTDITEKEGNYLLDIELPGCKKEDIDIQLDNGYLSISATRNSENEEKDSEGNLIRQERIMGTVNRRFYVGEDFALEDIHAKYDNGELKIVLPKKEVKLPETRKIMIE